MTQILSPSMVLHANTSFPPFPPSLPSPLLPCPVQNPKSKQHGFDLLTTDEKLVYPLAADSEEDLEEWMEALSKALGMEDEAVTGDGALPMGWGGKEGGRVCRRRGGVRREGD